MFRAYAPFLIRFSQEAPKMLGCPPVVAAATAFRQIAALGSGFGIAHAPVTIGEASCVASVQAMPSGTIVTEVDAAPTGLSPRVITGTALREAARIAATRSGRIAR